MTYSLDRIEEILGVESAALPATDDWTTLGDGGADQLVGSYTFSDGSWPLSSSWITWTDITLLADAGDDLLDGQAGNDRLYPGPGDDEVLGGSGTDAVAFVDSFGSGHRRSRLGLRQRGRRRPRHDQRRRERAGLGGG